MAAVRTMSTKSSSSTSTSSYVFIMIIVLSVSNVVISQTDVAGMLLGLKEDFENTSALDFSWIKGTNPCDNKKRWAGVACLKGKVRDLRLSGFNLSGDFTVDAIADLQGLRTIDIANNGFSGPIPDFYMIEGLRVLLANHNKFSGQIVPTFFATKQPSRLRFIDLSSNELSGKIPESLVTSTPNLKELSLQHNEFAGPVPLFSQNSLIKVNLSFNKLEGEIPEAMIVRFGADSFAENPALCSPKIGKECSNNNVTAKASPELLNSSATKWIVLGVLIVCLICTLLIRKHQKHDHFTPLVKENDSVHMHKAVSRSRTSSINRRVGHLSSNSIGSSSSRRLSGRGRGSAELIIVNDERGTFGLPDLMKASAEVLGNGALGSAYKAVMENGVSVVVKRLRDLNKFHRDEFGMQMRYLGALRHKNILPPLAYHYRREEKLVVNEFVARGSLLFLLHGDRGIAHSELTWPIRLKIIKGVAQGMAFLHSKFPAYELPHGNLKSSNILLSTDYEPLLSDYAYHPMFSSTEAALSLFAYRSPEALKYQQVSLKSDVYCLGMVILEVLTGKFPSQYFNNEKGGTDIVEWARAFVSDRRETELIDPEIASTISSSIGEMVRLLHIGVDCTNNEYDSRIDMNEAVSMIEDIQA
ncbi:transmembrane signal receptor [Lithospermum erythrorhizon]|uniref:Transmembrane signal receptor n=1 Tax=Lithospermum erythrorhizon TaxID=34254 RepID=A0AAV3S020_LITER